MTLSQEPPGDGSEIATDTRGTGNAGDIEISTARFSILDGPDTDNNQISTGSLADGNGGDITIEATESIDLRGREIGSQQNLEERLQGAILPLTAIR